MPLERFDEWARADGSRPAVVDANGGLTYCDVAGQSQGLATALAEAGISAGERVALASARSRELVPAMLAAWRLGAAYVPVDPGWPPARLADVLADSGARAVVAFGETSSGFMEHEIGVLDASRAAWIRPPLTQPATHVPGLAYVMYTSGSTGRPKGVEVPHAAVAALFRANEDWIDIGPGDTGLCFHAVTFDVSVWELFRPLTRGARLVICDPLAMRDPRAVVDWVADHRVTHLCQTPTAFRAFAGSAVVRGAEFPALRAVLLCGEALRFADIREWVTKYGDGAPAIWNVYGPTETTVYATARRVRRQDAMSEDRSLIGSSLGHVEVQVVPTNGENDGVGELVIAGVGVARGYRNLPDATAERFEGEGERRRFRSGDLARATPEGDIEFLGRRDAQVQVRGFRVELEEIEVQLRRHQAVNDCVATVTHRGSDATIVAGVVPVNGGPIDERDLRLHVADYLPSYMRPSRLIVLDRLPITQSGKLDRATAARELRASP